MRAILREEREVETQSISKLTASKAAVLIESAGIVGSAEQVAPAVPPAFGPVIEPFSWAGGEDARTPAAVTLFGRYLTAAGVPMAETGTGFKVVEVRRCDTLTTRIGRVLLKGRSDAVVIPAQQVSDDPSQQARVIVDFKVSTSTYAQIVAQAQGELVAASSLSHHDVLVVFTDLNTFGHILRANGDQLLVWKDLSVQQTIFKVATFLKEECAPVITSGADDVRVPGEPDVKRQRFALLQRAHALVPKPTELLEQLEVFNTGHWEDYLEGRDLVFSKMLDGHCPSYII